MKPIALTVLIASAAGIAACGPSSDPKGTGGKTTSKMDMKSPQPAPPAKQDAKSMDQTSKGDMKGMETTGDEDGRQGRAPQGERERDEPGRECASRDA